MTSARSRLLLQRFGIGLAVIAALALAVIGIRRATREEVLVRTARVRIADVVSSVSTNGKVEPVELFQAHAAGPGQVQAVLVHAGQQVSTGTLLLRLDTSDAAAKVQTALATVASANATSSDVRMGGTQEERINLQSDLDRAKLQLSQAQQALTVLQQLQARGAAAENEVGAARARATSAQAAVSLAQKRLTDRYAATDRERVQAQVADSRAGLNAAQQQLSNDVVRSPIAGTVFSLPIRPYDYVQSGEELAQVADLSRMEVRAYFDEPEIGKLHKNDLVVITWEAKPGVVWHGRIVRVPTTVILYGSRNVGEALLAVDDSRGDLLPNTNVTVNVTTQQVRGVPTLPREALRTLGASNFVYVVRKGVLHKTPVQVGALNLQSVQISGGLNLNDVVALNSTSNVDLADGMQVQEAR